MALGLPAPSHAADSASLELASGNNTQMLRFGAQWLWSKQWQSSNGTHIGGYWDLTLAQWREQHYKNNPDVSHNLVTIGITPVFRFQQDSKTGFYAEAGIGLHVFSDPYDNNGHILSGNVQFGDHIGVGYVFDNKLDLSLKIQHFSNGGVKEPNDGINFVVVKIGRSF
jgi:hypothetical protein